MSKRISLAAAAAASLSLLSAAALAGAEFSPSSSSSSRVVSNGESVPRLRGSAFGLRLLQDDGGVDEAENDVDADPEEDEADAAADADESPPSEGDAADDNEEDGYGVDEVGSTDEAVEVLEDEGEDPEDLEEAIPPPPLGAYEDSEDRLSPPPTEGSADEDESMVIVDGDLPPTIPTDETELLEEVAYVEGELERLEDDNEEEYDPEEAEEAKEEMEALAETLIESTFPPGCSWECYLDRYAELAGVGVTAERTEEAAIEHWIEEGRDFGLDCACDEGEEGADAAAVDGADPIAEEEGDEGEASEGGEGGPETPPEDAVAEGEDAAADEAENEEDDPKEMEEEPAALSEDAATEELEEVDAAEGGGEIEDEPANETEIVDGESASAEGDAKEIDETQLDEDEVGPENTTVIEDEMVNEELFEEILNVEELLDEAEEHDDEFIEEQEEYLEQTAEGLIEATFPPGCAWECYLDRYEDELGDVVSYTEEAAIKHWVEEGREHGKDCACEGSGGGSEEVAEGGEEDPSAAEGGDEEGRAVDGGGVDPEDEESHMEVATIVTKIADLNGTISQEEKEGLLEAAEGIIEFTFPPGCTWECYLAKNVDLRDEVAGSEEAAIAHWVGFGRVAERECSCDEGEDAAVEGEAEEGGEDADPLAEDAAASEEETPSEGGGEVEDELADEGGDDPPASPEEGLETAVVEDLYEALEEVEEALDMLEGEDDDEAEEEKEELEELEDELLEEAIGEVVEEALIDDEGFDQELVDTYEGVEDLEEEMEEEIENIEEDIEELLETDDDGEFEEDKEVALEYLTEIEGEVKEELQEEKQMEDELSELRDTEPNAFQDGESVGDGEGTPAILDWRSWDMLKVGVAAGAAALLLLVYAACRCCRRRKGGGRHDDGYVFPGGYRDDNDFT